MKNIFLTKTFALMLATSFTLSCLAVKADDQHQHNQEQIHDHGSDPIISKLMIDEFELSDSNSSGSLAAQAWMGTDIHKLWLKVNSEKFHGATENLEAHALYSRAISTYWDLQTGIRTDLKPSPSKTWGVMGIKGLAPYFFDIDAAIFIGEGGASAARFSAAYEMLFTQRLILSPEIETNFYGQNREESAKGAGLSDINAGLRLRYEFRRELAPYLGISWSKKFGRTADFAHANEARSGNQNKNLSVEETHWVLGVRAWF